MLFNQVHRLVAWLAQVSANPAVPASTPTVFEIDPMWHGDHWQNLLSSPMDARHYVMEDWSAGMADGFTDAENAASAH